MEAPDLSEIYERLNQKHFAGALPQPELLWNSRLRSASGRFIPGKRLRRPQGRGLSVEEALRMAEIMLGDRIGNVTDFEFTPIIEIATYLREEKEALAHIEDTMGHEMIHYWLWYRRRPYGHTPEFWTKMRLMGVSRYNTVPRSRAYRYLYRCPGCDKGYPARRRLSKKLACAACCKKFNSGYFDARFSLKLERQLSENEPLELY